jgi:hypothetical protein
MNAAKSRVAHAKKNDFNMRSALIGLMILILRVL